MRKSWLTLFLLFALNAIQAQELVKVGTKSITLNDFEERYQKSMADGEPHQSKIEYLETLIQLELKLSEAYDQGIDRSFNINNELNYYKEHLLQKYRFDRKTFNHLVNEAKERAAIHIDASYIVINIKSRDGIAEEKKIDEAFTQLNNGKSFANVAVEYSEDPEVKEHKGNIGLITCFVLPYKIETAIYSLKDGEFSAPFRFGKKWFIFKRNQTSPSNGKVQVQQLVFYYPGEVNQHNRDSLFDLAKKVKSSIGPSYSFDDAIQQYHQNPQALESRGVLNPIGVGEYESNFEKVIFNLKEVGEISEPFETSFGIHLVKLLSEKPHDFYDTQLWEQKVESNDRIAVAFEVLHQKIDTLLKAKTIDEKNLLATLKQVQNDFINNTTTVDSSKVLTEYQDQTLTVESWKGYFQIIRRNKSFFDDDELLYYYQQFSQQRLLSYYRVNIANFEKEYAQQFEQFKESILLFELMQKNIWNEYDSSKLHAYYQQNISKFKWQPYAKIWNLIPITQENIKTIIDKIQTVEQLKNLSSNEVYMVYSEKIPLEQIQNVDIKPGNMIKFSEEGMQFIRGIESIHEGGETKTYEEALTDITSLYQNELENKWLSDLRKKFPVVINKKLYKKLK